MHSSDVFVSPSGIAPAARSAATVGASAAARTPRRLTSPAALGRPAHAKDSLIVDGTPCSGPRSPLTASAASAAARAASKRGTADGAGPRLSGLQAGDVRGDDPAAPGGGPPGPPGGAR